MAGFCLLFNHLFRLLAPGVGQSTALTAISGAATLAAVVEHGVEDIRARGQVHPEVLAVYYLIAAFLRGNVLKGATITWFLTYARHIVEKPSAYVVVKSKKTDPTCHIHRCDHQVTVSREEADKGFGRLLRLLPQIALSAYRQGNLNLEDSLFKQVQSIAESRHAVIDGLENLKQGIHLKVVV